jgi:hypothetical protein
MNIRNLFKLRKCKLPGFRADLLTRTQENHPNFEP